MGDVMLKSLLTKLADGRTRSVAGLAQELGTSEELVKIALGQLVQMGYLAQDGGGGQEACSRCSSAECRLNSCDPGDVRVWSLTPRGKKLTG